MIENQFRYWQQLNLLAIGFPIVVQLAVFWYWSNVILIHVRFEHATGGTFF